MNYGSEIFLFVFLYLKLDSDVASLHTYQICANNTKESIIKNETNTTQCIGITRFDFINLTSGSPSCSENSSVTYAYPTNAHPCRLNRDNIDCIFSKISCQQKASFMVSSIGCNSLFHVFKFDYNWVPLQDRVDTHSIFNMTTLCTSNLDNMTLISISNDAYGSQTADDAIKAVKLNCFCELTLTTTTRLILHTYDNRLTKNQNMTLLYENGTHLKSWMNESDLLRVVNTDEITVDEQTLYLHWVNEADTAGGHFWISIEALNSTMGFVCSSNVTKAFYQAFGTTTASSEITTDIVTTPSASSNSSVTAQTLKTGSWVTGNTVNPDDITHSSVPDTSYAASSTRTSDTLTGISAVMSGSSLTTSSSQSSTIAASSGKPVSESNGSTGMTIGIVVGVVMLLLIIICACCVRWCIMKKNRTQPEDEKTPAGEVNVNPGNSGMFPPITMKHLPNPGNSRFSRDNHILHTVDEFQPEHSTNYGKNIKPATDGANPDQSSPEKKKKRKKKKRRKQDLIASLLGEDEQNITTLVYD